MASSTLNTQPNARPAGANYWRRFVVWVIDRLIDVALSLAYLALWVMYAWVRSRTGHANPRVRHLTPWTYMFYTHLLTRANITRWLKQGGELFPAVVQVQTINRCNAECQMCPYPYTVARAPRQVMDDAVYSKIVAECAAAPEVHEFVPMAQNEPLLDPKLEQRVAEFKAVAQPHQLVDIVTNGSALTPERAERLIASGVDMFNISFSAHTEATYNKVMPGLSWARIHRNLEALMKLDTSRVNLFLRFVRQRDNAAEYPAFRRYWGQRGFNVFEFSLNNRGGTVRNYEALLPDRSFIWQRLRRAMGRRFMRVCPHPFGIIHVLENGDVPLCANDWEHREVLGNVRNASLREIYNTPRMQEVRELVRQGRYTEIPSCKDCSFWKDWL